MGVVARSIGGAVGELVGSAVRGFLAARSAGFVTARPGAHYNAAKAWDDDPEFRPADVGPNKAHHDSSPSGIRSRSRALVDNDEHADGAIQAILDRVVGPGIGAEPSTGFEALDDELEDHWERYTRRVDPDRLLTLGASQALFLRECMVGGEAGVDHSIAEAKPDARAPRGPALDVIESERIPHKADGTSKATGNRVKQGVEIDKRGKPVAYRVYREPPDDETGLSGAPFVGAFAGVDVDAPELERVPVSRMELCFVRRRKGQLRGLPKALTAIRTARVNDGFVDANLRLARMLLNMPVFVETPSGTSEDIFKDRQTGDNYLALGADGRPLRSLVGLALAFVRPNSNIKGVQSNHPGPQFAAVIKALLERISRAFGVPSHTVSGNSSGLTLASGRLAENDAYMGFATIRQFVWDYHTAPLRRRVIDWLLLTGELNLDRVRARMVDADASEDELDEFDTMRRERPEQLYECTPVWVPRPSANPVQDANATGENLDNRVISHVQAIRMHGGTARRVVRQEARYLAMRMREYEKAGVAVSDDAGDPSGVRDRRIQRDIGGGGQGSGGSDGAGTGSDSDGESGRSGERAA